jgi:hypothetical protein
MPKKPTKKKDTNYKNSNAVKDKNLNNLFISN